MKKIFALTLAMALMLALFGCAAPGSTADTNQNSPAQTDTKANDGEKMTVKLGVTMGVTGNLAASTEQFITGIETALKHLDEDDALKNYKIELSVEDDQSDITQTVTNANKLAYKTCVDVVAGPTSATYAMSIVDILEGEKIPMIPGSWTPSLTHSGYEYVIRCCPNDITSANTMMSYLVEERGYKNIALRYLNSEQGSTGLDYGNDALSQYGMSYAIAESWSSGDTDMSGQILKISAIEPEAVVVWGGTAAEMSIALEQLKQYLDPSVQICASTMAGQPSVATLLDPACLTGVVYFTGWNPDSTDDYSKRFHDDFVQLHETNTEPSDVGARGYDAMMILAAALNSLDGYDVANDDFREKLNDAMHHVQVEGLQGAYAFDETGDGLENCILVEIQADGSHMSIYG